MNAINEVIGKKPGTVYQSCNVNKLLRFANNCLDREYRHFTPPLNMVLAIIQFSYGFYYCFLPISR
jgi:hypothetical protein